MRKLISHNPTDKAGLLSPWRMCHPPGILFAEAQIGRTRQALSLLVLVIEIPTRGILTDITTMVVQIFIVTDNMLNEP